MADPCRVIQQQDEKVCATCSLRWDVSEPAPICPRQGEPAPEADEPEPEVEDRS